MAVNTSWREDIRHTVFPNAKRGRRFAAGCIKGLCSLHSKGRWGEKTVFPKAGGFKPPPGLWALGVSGSARRAIPPPFEPSEPSRPKGVSNGNPQPSGPEGPSNLRTFLQPFPADWYLSTYASLSSCTEILHFVQNDASGGKYASDSFSIPHSPIPSP